MSRFMNRRTPNRDSRMIDAAMRMLAYAIRR
jgi:hypothetical protein